MSATVKDCPSGVFDFTKRKRWADLLITELADTILLVLSAADCRILYCGSSVSELLGWRDTELLDRDFGDLVCPEDIDSFRDSFQQGEFLVHSRLKRRGPLTPPTRLFEINARPELPYVILMARPYPGRNTSSLNTYLELKIENERLQNRLRDLTGNAPGSAMDDSPVMVNRYPPSTVGPLPLYTSTSLAIGEYDEPAQSPAKRNLDASSSSGASAQQASLYASTTLVDHQEDEEAGRKKKAKKAHASDQYVCVTCGRTDSPEWRKGPLGPKTLCNACGLRWAKSLRKTDEANGPGDGIVGEIHMT